MAQIASGEAPDPVRRVSGGNIEHGGPLPATLAPTLRAPLLRRSSPAQARSVAGIDAGGGDGDGRRRGGSGGAPETAALAGEARSAGQVGGTRAGLR